MSNEQYPHEEIRFPGVEKCTIQILPGAIELITLIVEDSNRGQGIGTQVIQNIKKRFPYHFIMVCPVATDPARQLDCERFYRKNGFLPQYVKDVKIDQWAFAPYRKKSTFQHD